MLNMTYRILVEHVEGGWVATVFDAEQSVVADCTGPTRYVTIERAKHVARNNTDDPSPVFVIEDLSE